MQLSWVIILSKKSPADTTTNQVFEDEDDDLGSSDEEMPNAFENTGSGAEDEDAEGAAVDQGE